MQSIRRARALYCPKFCSKKRIWGPEDLGYLGLGSMLYLNFMRWMSLLFFFVGIFSIPNAYLNSLGPRYTQNDLEVIEYAATHASIANLGSQEWTPGGDNYCNGHGFYAEACAPGGWNMPGTAYEYECGKSPSLNTSLPSPSLGRFIFGGVDVACTAKESLCMCMPGWIGARCDQADPNIPALAVNGFCVPSIAWWTHSTVSERDKFKADSEDVRLPSICNGHGGCVARTKTKPSSSSAAAAATNTSDVAYTFCSCDDGYYGDQCQYTTNPTTDVHGDFYGYAYSIDNADKCERGALPEINREFLGVVFPAAECKAHGFGIKLPTNADGKLQYSNTYRVQTPSLCFCEPGFQGEECLGGEAVPDSEGWFAAVSSLILLSGCAILYRHRKTMEQVYDDGFVTPADFSLFVNGLPKMKIDEIGEIVAHFEQFAPVHFISPATDDEKLVSLQQEKDLVLEQLQVMQERDTHRRQEEAGHRSRAFRKAKKEALAASNTTTEDGYKGVELQENYAWAAGDAHKIRKEAQTRPAPVSVPSITTLVGDAVDHPRKVPFRWWARLLMQIPVLNSLVFTRNFLHKYLMYLNDRIVREMHEQHVTEFNRAFVTFEYSQDQEDVMNLYAQRREGIFGRRKPFGRSVAFTNTRTGETRDVNMLFRGKKIQVEQASEPDEVLWDSLDVGPRMRCFRMFCVSLLMVAFIVAAFVIVVRLNAEKQGGIIGILIALGVLALNILAAQTWIASADVEQHYKAGAKMRSVFWKTLITQICITVLAGTIGVYGYPLDGKNGYIQDWYKEAGGFVFRMVLIESVVPPVINLLSIPYRLQIFFARFIRSKVEWNLAHVPPSYILAERCAALMRTVILCCAFNAGLPVLNFAVAVGLFVRYWSDKYCMKNLFRLQKAGAELPRALELCLMFATAINIIMNWVTLRVAWSTNLVTEVVFYIGVIGTMWAILGYFSYKVFRGRDCWGGSGPLVPLISWLCCFNERVLAPFTYIHETFMKLVFGQYFFGGFSDSIDETGGKSYDLLRVKHRLRRIPYYQLERAKLFPEWDSGEVVPLPMTGAKYLESIKEEATAVVTADIVVSENPMLVKQRNDAMREIALERKMVMLAQEYKSAEINKQQQQLLKTNSPSNATATTNGAGKSSAEKAKRSTPKQLSFSSEAPTVVIIPSPNPRFMQGSG